jgi:hypothetical protein
MSIEFGGPNLREPMPRALASRRMAFSIFGLLYCVYLLVYSGVPHSTDELVHLSLGQTLARGQPPNANERLSVRDASGVALPDGKLLIEGVNAQ